MAVRRVAVVLAEVPKVVHSCARDAEVLHPSPLHDVDVPDRDPEIVDEDALAVDKVMVDTTHAVQTNAAAWTVSLVVIFKQLGQKLIGSNNAFFSQ